MGELFAALLGGPCCLLDSGVGKQAQRRSLIGWGYAVATSQNVIVLAKVIHRLVGCSVST
jgi:hypothetical protein